MLKVLWGDSPLPLLRGVVIPPENFYMFNISQVLSTFCQLLSKISQFLTFPQFEAFFDMALREVWSLLLFIVLFLLKKKEQIQK